MIVPFVTVRTVDSGSPMFGVSATVTKGPSPIAVFSFTVIGNTVSDTVVVSTTVIAAVVLNVLALSTLSVVATVSVSGRRYSCGRR